MSNFPNELDTDIELPRVDDNIIDIGADAINAIRQAIFNIEENLGLTGAGTLGSLSERLDVSIDPNGTIKPAAISGLGLVTLPIYNAEISDSAAIAEYKLNLDHSTQDLYDFFLQLQNGVSILNGWLSISGTKLEPHISGDNYRHSLSHIDVDASPVYKDKNNVNRNNTNANTLLTDINTDLTTHEKSDGSDIITTAQFTQTFNGSLYPAKFAHTASGLFIDPSRFSTVPQSADNLQDFAEFVDNSSSLLIGSRIDTFYENCITRTSKASSLINDGYGQSVVPPTLVITYLLNNNSTVPVDDINYGDDVILFNPTSSVLSSNIFDSQFLSVKSGDIITINYGDVLAKFVIDSVKKSFSVDGFGVKTVNYAVRINGKNLFASTTAYARIDRSLSNEDKYGVLAVAHANNSFNEYSSLIVANPRSAVALGNGFNPFKIDSNHYNLYLILYPSGDPTQKVVNLPAIDITGNQGATPGAYTLDSIIESTNTSFRSYGYNFRFIAFQYRGDFGVMLADPYDNASFSIIGGTVDGYGNYTAGSNSSYPANIVDNYNITDPLGLGINGSNLASSPYSISFATPEAAKVPTLILTPLKKRFYYVNGSEKEFIRREVETSLDSFGDGYWVGSIYSKQTFVNRVEVVYKINLDLSQSGLKKGKTLVTQHYGQITDSSYSSVNYGRFTIKDVSFANCPGPDPYTLITVIDGIHATGTSPYISSSNITVKIYFSDDSVEFDAGHVIDTTSLTPYKRFFEVLVSGAKGTSDYDQSGHTFTHERARFLYSALDIGNVNFYKVSPKLRGYSSGITKKIRLNISNYSATTGNFDGYLSAIDGTHQGSIVSGRKGEIARFYDETNIDYIDFIFKISDSISTFTNKTLDIELFSTLSLDDDLMFISSCQLNDQDKQVSYVKDERPFGIISEKQLSSSALDFISTGEKLLHQNGVVRGFNVGTPVNGTVNISGGVALIDGKFVQLNDSLLVVPEIREIYSSTQYTKINWALCVNNRNEFQLIPLLDYDSSSPATPNNINRIFNAFNPVNSSTYALDASKFSNIVNNRKDLTILYVISSVVSSPPVLTITDARKYCINSDGNITPVLSSNKNQGNFYSFEALNNWLTYNSDYNSKVKIHGTFNNIVNLNFSNQIQIERDGYASITLDTSSSISNVIFNDLDFIIESSAVLSCGNNVEFNNCNITINTVNGLTLTGSTTFNKCNFTINSYNGLRISSSNVKIENSVFDYEYDALGDGYFSSSNFINNGRGCIYCLPVNYENIFIRNNIFNTSSLNHYSFIDFDFFNLSTSLSNIVIKNNKFNCTETGDDQRSVISFVSSNLTSTSDEILSPRINGCNISGNICNKNQMIAITGILLSNSINNPIITSNVIINENICGVIGFATQSERSANFANTTLIKDKANNLLVSNNNVKAIFISDHTGQNIGFGQLSSSNKKISNITIDNNITSSISILVKARDSQNNANVKITNNNIFAYNSTFLSTYGLTAGINVASAISASNQPDQVIISGNMTSKGTSLNSDLTTYTDYYFSSPVIKTRVSATITNNSFRGLSAIGILADIGGTNHLVSDNFFYRDGYTISSYITSSGNSVIVDNFFDNATVDGSNELVVDNSSATSSIYERNKNQTAYMAIPLYDAKMTADGYLFYSPDADYDLSPGLISSSKKPNFSITVDDTSGHNTKWMIELSSKLPNSVQILEIKSGIFANAGSGVPDVVVSSNYYTMIAQSTNINITNFSTGTDSIIDPASTQSVSAVQSNVIDFNSAGALVPLRLASSFLSANTSSNSAFITNNNRLIELSVLFDISLASGTQTILVSPIVIRYRW